MKGFLSTFDKNRLINWFLFLIFIVLLAGIGGTSWGYFYALQQQGVAEEKAEEAWRASELAKANEKLAGIASSNTKAFADHLVNDFLRVARPEGWNDRRVYRHCRRHQKPGYDGCQYEFSFEVLPFYGSDDHNR